MVINLTTAIKNDSVQVGDAVYSGLYVGQYGQTSSTMTYVGIITDIGINSITIASPVHTPSPDDFIMFSKDKTVNNTSLLGYYAEVKMSNNSIEHAELFALSSETTLSSK
jgi:hypothetical protein